MNFSPAELRLLAASDRVVDDDPEEHQRAAVNEWHRRYRETHGYSYKTMLKRKKLHP